MIVVSDRNEKTCLVRDVKEGDAFILHGTMYVRVNNKKDEEYIQCARVGEMDPICTRIGYIEPSTVVIPIKKIIYEVECE